MGLIEKVGSVQRLEQGDRWPKEKLRGQRGHRTHSLRQQSVWSIPASSGSWCDWKTESEEEDTKIIRPKLHQGSDLYSRGWPVAAWRPNPAPLLVFVHCLLGTRPCLFIYTSSRAAFWLPRQS